MPRPVLALGAAVLAALAPTFVACRRDPPSETMTAAAPLYPPVPAIGDCTPPQCQTLVSNLPVAHGGVAISLRTRPSIDDAVARYGDCLDDVVSCYSARGVGALRDCLAGASRCDGRCVEAARAAIDGAANEWAAFRATFLAEGSACRPSSSMSAGGQR